MTADTSNLRIGFIGAGQLATPLAWSLARAGYHVAGAASRSPASAARLATGIAGARAYDDPQRLADDADLVLIAVPDDAIAAVAQSVRWQARHGVVHCSGATEVSVLAPAAAAGASVGGFHPMQSFTDTQAAIESLPGCSIAIEAEEPLPHHAHRHGAGAGLPPDRAAAGRARALSRVGQLCLFVPGGAARRCARPVVGLRRRPRDGLSRPAAADAGHGGRNRGQRPVRSLAGPIARADVGTVERHLAALGEKAPALLATYLDLARRSLPIAEAKGGADKGRFEGMRALLERSAAR